MDNLLLKLSEAPDDIIAEEITPKLKELVAMDQISKIIEFRKIIHKCAYGSLASESMMRIMHCVYHQMSGHWCSLHALRALGKQGDFYIDKDDNLIQVN